VLEDVAQRGSWKHLRMPGDGEGRNVASTTRLARRRIHRHPVRLTCRPREPPWGRAFLQHADAIGGYFGAVVPIGGFVGRANRVVRDW